jgi:iron complex outermembrane receptor protein
MDLYLNYNKKVSNRYQIDVTGGYTYQDFRDS